MQVSGPVSSKGLVLALMTSRYQIQDDGPTTSDPRWWPHGVRSRWRPHEVRYQMAVPVTRSVTPRRVSQRPRPREGSITS